MITQKPPQIDFKIPKGNLVPRLSATLTFPKAINLTAATLKLAIGLPGQAAAQRDATFTPLPNAAAATSATVEGILEAADVATAEKVFNIQWHFTLGDTSPFDFPPDAATVDEPERVYQRLKIMPTLV